MGNKCCNIIELNKDHIICPVCGNKITDLKLLRCPRCFTSLIPQGCGAGCHGCGAKAKGGR